MPSQDPTSDDPPITYPLPISRLANRYYLYSVHHISHLRRHHNIPGVLIGSLPQAPQQNFFLGLPLQLLPEEARLLCEKGVCYIVDDVVVHRQGLKGLREEERERYMGGLRDQGREVSRAAVRRQEESTEKALRGMSQEKREMVIRKKEEARARAEEKMRVQLSSPTPGAGDLGGNDEDDDETLFPSYERGAPKKMQEALSTPRSSTPSLAPSVAPPEHHHITPTTSLPLILPPSSSPTLPHSDLPPVNPAAYSLYKHLASHNYFMSPGLRFGCQYMAYPGDPLRFHSHFLCGGYGWDEEIELLDLVGGGRLGTGVKKGFLIGGQAKEVKGGGGGVGSDGQESEEEDGTRVFCIEWGGM